ncbi:hypothetical protein HDU78_004734 [Chytriomyces hyalinus]|nr:hypothetical protein HDU78_004734 [Chytriomyces hyalinus]
MILLPARIVRASALTAALGLVPPCALRTMHTKRPRPPPCPIKLARREADLNEGRFTRRILTLSNDEALVSELNSIAKEEHADFKPSHVLELLKLTKRHRGANSYLYLTTFVELFDLPILFSKEPRYQKLKDDAKVFLAFMRAQNMQFSLTPILLEMFMDPLLRTKKKSNVKEARLALANLQLCPFATKWRTFTPNQADALRAHGGFTQGHELWALMAASSVSRAAPVERFEWTKRVRAILADPHLSHPSVQRGQYGEEGLPTALFLLEVLLNGNQTDGEFVLAARYAGLWVPVIEKLWASYTSAKPHSLHSTEIQVCRQASLQLMTAFRHGSIVGKKLKGNPIGSLPASVEGTSSIAQTNKQYEAWTSSLQMSDHQENESVTPEEMESFLTLRKRCEIVYNRMVELKRERIEVEETAGEKERRLQKEKQRAKKRAKKQEE